MAYEEVIHLIDRHQYIGIITHIMPDGDTLGSALALGAALKGMGKRVSVFNQDGVPAKYKFLVENGDIGVYTKHQDCTLVITVDCSDIDRLGDSFTQLFKNAQDTVNIDHHKSNNMYADINIVETDCGATGEIVYKLIKQLPVGINKYMAECLYVALSTDTGSFSYSNTTSQTFAIASNLAKHEINIGRISRELFYKRSLDKTKLIGIAIDNITLYFENRVAIVYIENASIAHLSVDEEDFDGLINYAREIEGVEVAVLIRNKGDSIKIGLRSNTYVDVSAIAQKFGGGGHERAAGCIVEGTDVKGTIKPLLAEIAAHLD